MRWPSAGGRGLSCAPVMTMLAASLCLGALYMLLIDDLARTLSSSEIPLGILTALIGAPLFALLLRRAQVRGWHD